MRSLIILVIVLACPILSKAQNQDTVTTRKQERKSRPTYYDIGIGFNNSVFRDFATSPLFYQGTRSALSIDRRRESTKRASNFGFSFHFGRHSATVRRHFSSSLVYSVFLDYRQLYQVRAWSNEHWNFKVGGEINYSTNIRVNQSLGNNGFGTESFLTLFGSIKATRDISRKTEKNKKILFIKYKLRPRKRTISFRLNPALMNNTLRNGFAYIDQSSVLNDPVIYGGYELKLFSGYRLNTALNYVYYLTNKNAFKISYEWDAFVTGGNLDKFEMGNHIFQFSFLFNTK